MFYAESKILRKFAPHVGSVLVVDPFPAAARLLCDLLKQLGSKTVIAVSNERDAERVLVMHEPKLIFTEYGGEIDGPGFVRRLRRGPWVSRKAPVIMCTAEATEQSLKAARDAGVHEFLCKPFTVGHLVKRVEASCLKEREWIEARMYVGPCRRRFNSASVEFEGARKRKDDTLVKPAVREVEECTVDVLGRVLAGIQVALIDFDLDPAKSLRSMVQQSAELQAMAFASEDEHLRRAVAALQRYLLAALETNSVSRAELAAHADALALFATDAKAPASLAA